MCFSGFFATLLLCLAISVCQADIYFKKIYIADGLSGKFNKAFLDSFVAVEELELKNSHIENYPKNFSAALPNLRRLVVMNTSFDLHREKYQDNSNLREIEGYGNRCPDFDLTVYQNTSFEKILMNGHDFVRKIPKNFADGTHRLKSFECSNSGIEIIEEDAFNALDKLENLNLNKNSIKTLPKNVLNPLKSLKKLDLSYNLIEVFGTEDIQGLPNLEYINIGNNPLKELNLVDIDKTAPKLRMVDIRNTDVTETQIDEHIKKTKLRFIIERGA